MTEPSDHLPPLPREIEDFIRPERERVDPPPEILDGVFSKLQATLHFPALPAPRPETGRREDPEPSSDAAPIDSARPVGLAKTALLSRSSLRTLATLLIGAAAGAGIHEGLDRRSDRRREAAPSPTHEAPRPTPSAQPVPPPLPSPLPASGPPTPLGNHPAVKPMKIERERPANLPQRDRDLAAERTLIEQARTALSREKGEVALAALERHRRDFPHGALEEERESLWVQVLVELERNDQARQAGASFHLRFPRSIFGAVVDEALESIP